jgi:hypothetical protein
MHGYTLRYFQCPFLFILPDLPTYRLRFWGLYDDFLVYDVIYLKPLTLSQSKFRARHFAGKMALIYSHEIPAFSATRAYFTHLPTLRCSASIKFIGYK